MAVVDIQEYLKLIPAVAQAPARSIWLSYHPDTDTLYVNFKKPAVATNSELTDDDIIIRYEGEQLIGFTVLHAAQRSKEVDSRLRGNDDMIRVP